MTITEQTGGSTDETPADDTFDANVDEFVEKLFSTALAAQELQATYLGDVLGYYAALAEGPATSTELAQRTNTSERYAREWLEQQTVSGWLTCPDPTAPGEDRHYELPAAHAEVLTKPESLAHVLPLARFICGLGKHIDAIVDAFKTGGGVSWAELGADPREAQAAMNRPMFVNQLGPEYFASIPEIHSVLEDGGRVADIGAGLGWAAIGVAQAYPSVSVDAYDLDAPSIEGAQQNIKAAGLDDRVTATCVDAAEVDRDGQYDLVMALECVHDMPDPVGVLTTMGKLAGDDGIVIVMDENVGDDFTGQHDDVERLMYGFSLMCCLPDGLAHDHSVGTGTVMRRPTFEGYARQAGFGSVEVLPIENDFFRFYRLTR